MSVEQQTLRVNWLRDAKCLVLAGAAMLVL